MGLIKGVDMGKSDDSPMTPKKLFIIIVEVVLVFMLAIIIVGVVQQFLIAPIRVSGSSMAPTIRDSGDKVYVYRAIKNYKIGDVIVFYKPESGVNDESLNPSSKKTTFTEFLRALPIIGSRISTSDEVESSGSGYKAIIKRIVACPGDTVCFVDGYLYVNGNVEERFIYKWTSVGVGDNYSHTLGKDEYFVLGDNRSNSIDSEDYGPINVSMIYGKAVLLITDGKFKTSF